MSSYSQWAQSGPHIPVLDNKPGALSRAEADSAARAFAIGERWPAAAPPSRRAPRRGDLPDVDFSQVVGSPRRSIWSRIKAAFRASSSEVPASEEPQLDVPAAPEPKAAPADNVIQFRRAA